MKATGPEAKALKEQEAEEAIARAARGTGRDNALIARVAQHDAELGSLAAQVNFLRSQVNALARIVGSL